MSPGQAVLVGFAATILLGTALLMLPAAHHGPGRAGFVQALFTATSASSVTGLTVVDTGSYWSGFGQVIILLLIQVGGFGILSAGALLVLATGGRIGLRTRMLAQTESNALTLQDLRRVLARIAVVTFGVELLITFALFGRLLFGHDYAFGDAAWFGLFHGVSAFYGAGFSLWGDSLMRFAEDAAIIVPVGGGSSASAAGIVLKNINEKIEVIGCQSAQAPAAQLSWAAGKIVTAPMKTFAEGVATRVPFENTQRIMRQYLDDFLLVDDREIEAAILLYLQLTHNLAEGAGAIPLATALKHKARFAGKKIVLVLSGGNLHVEKLRSIISRHRGH